MRRSEGPWFRPISQTVAWRYGIGLAAFLVSFFVRDLLNNWLLGISDRGLIIFLPAILLVAFFLGLGPAILTALLSVLAAWYFFIPPYYSFALGVDGAVVLAALAVGSAVGIALVHWLRISIATAQALARQAEALARQREVLIETDPNGILVVDAEGRIQRVNGQLTKLFGYRRDELTGQPVETLLPERYRRGHVLLRAEFSEQPTNRPMGAGRELYGLRKDSSEFPVEIGLASFLEESRELILATVVDITERKQREQAQAKYLRMLDAGFDAIILRDAQDRITGWNRGAESLYGWVRKEVLGRDTHSLFQTEFPKTLDEILADMRRDGHWEGELIHTRKDGARIVVFSRWTPEWDAKNGQLVSVLQTNTDITERKQAEALVAADLRDMTRVVQLSNRLVREGSDFNKNLEIVVDTAIAITSADKGNLQLLDPTTGALTIAAQHGFEEPFLKFFASVRDDASACAAAMRSGEQVVVEDVRESKIFAGQPSKDVLIEAGVFAVISTPLMASTGNLLGMVSTHFAKPHRPSERELHLTDLLARQTADYLERKRAGETEKTLAREIQHRSSNLLAIIQTIATRSLSGSYTLAEAKAAFEARLQALARANRELTKSNWSGVNLGEIVRSELRPYAERTIVHGIDVILSPQHAQNFTLTLHELATNAAKYGALSNGSGKVGVSWMITRLNGNNKLGFKWQERGGPPVVVPIRQGFGTTLLKATFPDARIDYAVEGLNCEIDIPIGQDEVPVPEKRQVNAEQKRYVEECLKIARSGTDERTRAIFSQMAQVWSRLAEEKAKSSNE